MTFLCKRAAVWLALLLHAYSVQASSFWTYTSRYQLSTSYDLYTNTYLSYVRTYPYSYTRTIESTITPTVKPYSTSTAAGVYTVSDLELIYEWYTAGAVAETDLVPDTIHGSARATGIARSRYTVYYMGVTMTPPAECSSKFTFSTTVGVYIPTQVQDQMKPTSVTTSSSYVTAYLTDGAAPYSTEDDFYYTEYIQSCSNPTAGRSVSTGRPSSGNGNDNGNSNSYGYSYCFYNCNVLKTWAIVLAVVLPTLFLLGFIESWFWFRRLMTGRGAMRFGTISWIGISLWVACFTRFQSARSQNDQKLLRQKWKAMSGGTAFKLWWKWGFKHRYPTELLGEYSRNDSGVPGVPGDTTQPMAFTGGFNGPPPPGPPPGPPPFINHNGTIYIPQTQQSPHAPQATSYLDYGGIIYVPQVAGYAPSTVSSNNFAPSPPPQGYPAPQGYNSFYDPQKEAHVTTSHSPGPPTEISSVTHSPPNQHAQPAPSEVSGVSSYVAAQHGQVVYTAPVEVEGNRTENAPEWIPPKTN